MDLPQPDGPDEHDELVVADGEIDALDDLDGPEGLGDLVQLDLRHRSALLIDAEERRRIARHDHLGSLDPDTVGRKPRIREPTARREAPG